MKITAKSNQNQSLSQLFRVKPTRIVGKPFNKRNKTKNKEKKILTKKKNLCHSGRYSTDLIASTVQCTYITKVYLYLNEENRENQIDES